MNASATLAEAIATGRGVERPFKCQVHDDTNASASVNVLKMVWYCYACGASGVVDDESAVPTADDLLVLLKEEEPIRAYPESWLDVFDADRPSPYWEGRFGYQVARRFRCGTHPVTGQPTYPLRDPAGTVLGVVVRDEDGQPKYKYPYGVRTSQTMFGAIAPAEVIVLLEGAADVMALHQAGLPANWAALGCYGAGLHWPQAMLIAEMSPKVVVAAFDDDTAGMLATERATYSLADIAPVVSHRWAKVGGKDPGECAVADRITGIQASLKATPFARIATQ